MAESAPARLASALLESDPDDDAEQAVDRYADSISKDMLSEDPTSLKSWMRDYDGCQVLVVPVASGGYWLDVTRIDGNKVMCWGPYSRQVVEQIKRCPEMQGAQWLGC